MRRALTLLLCLVAAPAAAGSPTWYVPPDPHYVALPFVPLQTFTGGFTASAASTITAPASVPLTVGRTSIGGVIAAFQNVASTVWEIDTTGTLSGRNNGSLGGSRITFDGGNAGADFARFTIHSSVGAGLFTSAAAAGANTGFTFNASNSPDTVAAFQSGGTSRFLISVSGQRVFLNGASSTSNPSYAMARNSTVTSEGDFFVAGAAAAGFRNIVQGDVGIRVLNVANAILLGPGTSSSISPFRISATFSGNTLLTSVLTAGAAPASVAGNGTDATDATLQGSAGGATSGTTGQAAGDGSSVGIDAGNGGDAPFGSTNGDAGDVPLRPGKPGAGLGSAGADGAVRIAYASGTIGAPLEFAGGTAPALSPSNEGRIFYNSSTQTFQGSANAGAYTSFTVGGISAPVVNNVQFITTTGASTLTLTAGTEAIIVYAVAGGGGGGGVDGAATGVCAAGGGASGSGAIHYITNPDATYDLNIGIGGAAGAAGNNAGTAGDNTTFAVADGATIFTCTGGGGGAGAAASTANATVLGGAPAATGSGATTNLTGNAGDHGLSLTTAVASGNGGASMLGGAALGRVTSGAGNVGRNYGGGGSGAAQTGDADSAGGAGAPGAVLVIEYK